VYAPEGTTFQPRLSAFFVTYFWNPAPSTSSGHSPPTTWSVATVRQTEANRSVSSWVPRKYMYEYLNVFAAPLLL
jgi:hypothetical protein